MKDLAAIASLTNIPENFLRGSIGLFTIQDEIDNPHSYYHRITPNEKRILEMPDLDECTNAIEVGYFYREYLGRNPNMEFKAAVLTKWVMVASTEDQLLIPFKIAFESELYDIAQSAARKIYALF